MKNKLITLITLFTFGLTTVVNLSAGTSDGSNSGKEVIPIIKKNPHTPHRSQDSSISCYYQSGVLYFSTWEDLGEAEIIVEDTETGFYSEDTLNGIDATTINIAGASGTVLIYVNTADASYYGELEL